MRSFQRVNMGKKDLNPIPLTDIQFWEGVPSHTEDGSKSLHIIQQASCGITNKFASQSGTRRHPMEIRDMFQDKILT